MQNFGRNFIFTDSGKTIVSCDKDIRVWNYANCQLQHTFSVGETDIDTLCLINLEHVADHEDYGRKATGLMFGG